MPADTILNRDLPGALTRKMRVVAKRIFRGPHYYSHTPMVQITLDLGALEDWPTNKIPYFKEGLVAMLPGLQSHGCSYGEPGGFIKRMTEGTWLGHVVEHVSLELQAQIGIKTSRGKTRSVRGKPGVYNVMFGYETERVGLAAGRYALEIVNSLLPRELAGVAGLNHLDVKGQPPFTNIKQALRYLEKLAGRERLGPTTRSIVEAAQARDIPVIRLDDQSYVQLGWGKNQRRIRASVTDRTSMIAVEAAGDKALTKKLLKAVGVPVPEGDVVTTVDGALEVAMETGFPVTIKPLDGNHGRGVTTNIMTEQEVRRAFELAKEHSRHILVERHYTGKDYRVLVIDGKMAAVAERVPAHVTGDGVHSIAELVGMANADPKRGDGHANVLSKIILDTQVEHILERARLSPASIPAQGQKVTLRDSANLSTGGTAIDRTNDIHPANAASIERAVRAIGLDIAGVDIVAEDIAKPLGGTAGGIVEINAAPGFRMHLCPCQGQARPVGEAVTNMLFPKDAPARIPLVAVTGTNGKSTTTRMIVHMLRQTGACVGYASTSGVFLNDDVLWEGDASGPQSARMLLREPSVEMAVLETARGGILREGLAFDYCDVGIVLNVTADHLGMGGIDRLEDLADVKSVVAESVKKNGVSVLNADDPLTRRMADVAGGKICYISMQGGHERNEFIAKHIEQGGMAVIRENWMVKDEIVYYHENQRLVLMPTDKIAAAHGGTAEFNIQNALAAAAAALSLGVDARLIRVALSSFVSTFEENPGRLNISDKHGFRVILDYAHNPAALVALGRVVSAMRPEGKSLIGTVSIPGDRRDDDIREMGRIAAGIFDILVFREAPDRRGREAGGVLRLLAEGARSAGFPEEDLICVDTEEEATDVCMERAQPGDIVVLTPTQVKAIWERAMAYTPAKMAAPADNVSVFHA